MEDRQRIARALLRLGSSPSSRKRPRVASWVDDMIFIMSTPEHGECAGFEGGYSVCAEFHGRALKVQELWHAKALKLDIPLPWPVT
jgi:hypothetical protein